jgi:cytidylate kinase
MMDFAHLVLLSGAVSAGKTSVAGLLAEGHGFSRVSTSGYLKRIAAQRGIIVNRVAMQDLGDQQDIDTDFTWPVTVAQAQMAEKPSTRWLLDAARKRRQVHHFRERMPGTILHVHLWAPEGVLRARYQARQAAGEEYGDGSSYDEFVKRPNEVESRSLIDIADLRIDTSLTSSAAAVLRIIAGLFGDRVCDTSS